MFSQLTFVVSIYEPRPDDSKFHVWLRKMGRKTPLSLICFLFSALFIQSVLRKWKVRLLLGNSPFFEKRNLFQSEHNRFLENFFRNSSILLYSTFITVYQTQFRA